MTIFLVIVVFLAVGIIAALAGKLKKNGEGEGAPKGPITYRARLAVLTAAERSFLASLRSATPEHLDLYAKVRLADFIEPTPGQPQWQKAFNMVAQKHVDFLMVEKTTQKPVAGIELDDQSHSTQKAQRRDAFVEDAFRQAKIKLHRFPARAAYSPAYVASVISGAE